MKTNRYVFSLQYYLHTWRMRTSCFPKKTKLSITLNSHDRVHFFFLWFIPVYPGKLQDRIYCGVTFVLDWNLMFKLHVTQKQRTVCDS